MTTAWAGGASLLASLLLLISAASQVGAVQVQRLTSTCAECRISLTHVATFGAADGPAAIGQMGLIAHSGDGRWFVVTTASASNVLVFDSTGTVLATIGRSGEGPGEYRGIWRLFVDDEHLHVYDGRLSRETILSLDDYSVVRSVRLTGPLLNIALFADGLLAVNAAIRTPELVGQPLHILREGDRARSFGGQGEQYLADVPYSGMREIAPARAPGSFWAAYKNRYRVQKWDTAGNLLVTLNREADWFQPHERGVGFDPSVAPAPVLMAIQEDAQGVLWTLTAVADAEWRSALTPMPGHPDGNRYAASDMNDYLDTVIEAIDPVEGVVLASTRVDQHFFRFADAAHTANTRFDANDVPYVDVFSFRLIRPETR